MAGKFGQLLQEASDLAENHGAASGALDPRLSRSLHELTDMKEVISGKKILSSIQRKIAA